MFGWGTKIQYGTIGIDGGRGRRGGVKDLARVDSGDPRFDTQARQRERELVQVRELVAEANRLHLPQRELRLEPSEHLVGQSVCVLLVSRAADRNGVVVDVIYHAPFDDGSAKRRRFIADALHQFVLAWANEDRALISNAISYDHVSREWLCVA